MAADGAATIRAKREQQRLDALAKANQVRTRDALVKQLLRSGKLDPLALVGGTLPDDERHRLIEGAVAKWSLSKLLAAVPGMGPARTHEVLVAFKKGPGTKFSALTFKQRETLAQLVEAARDQRFA